MTGEIKKRELSEEFRKEFIKDIHGKDHILYGGLLTLARAEGIQSIHVELLQAPSEENDHTAICKATVVDKNGNTWSEIGDANDENCNSKIAPHKIRMAATRAKARALRDMLGIDTVVDVELTDPYEKEMITQHQARTIKRLMKQKGLGTKEVSKISYSMFGVKTAALLTKEQAESLIAELEMYDEENPPIIFGDEGEEEEDV